MTSSAPASKHRQTDGTSILSLFEGDERVESFVREADDIVRLVVLRGGRVQRSHIASAPHTPGEDLASLADQLLLRSTRPPATTSDGVPVRVVDLFSGCGGISLGAAEAARAVRRRFEPVLACDWADEPLKVYSRNFPDARVVREDLSLMSSLIGSAPTPVERRLFGPIKPGVDLLLAGPPCQGHSNLNNHTRRSDPKNELYMKVARAVELLRPKFVIIENVPGVRHDQGKVVDRTRDAIQSLGYRTDAALVDLSRLGVPQSRRRHVMVAVARDSETAFTSVRATAARFGVAPRSVRWGIGDLMDIRRETLFDHLPGMTEVTRQRIDLLFDEGLFELPDDHRPDCHRTKAHTYGSVYGRMRWDVPSPTITGGFLSMGRGRFVHPERRGTLTPHEAARIQYFPDYFDFGDLVNRRSLAEAIGNAVPPKLSFVLATELLR